MNLDFDETVQDEKWQNLKIRVSNENFILLVATDGKFYFVLKPSCAPEDFDYLRKLFLEKLI